MTLNFPPTIWKIHCHLLQMLDCSYCHRGWHNLLLGPRANYACTYGQDRFWITLLCLTLFEITYDELKHFNLTSMQKRKKLEWHSLWSSWFSEALSLWVTVRGNFPHYELNKSELGQSSSLCLPGQEEGSAAIMCRQVQQTFLDHT